MNTYAIYGGASEGEAPLVPIYHVSAYGFAHALELAIADMPAGSVIGLVVVKLRRSDACKVYKVGVRGGFARP